MIEKRKNKSVQTRDRHRGGQTPTFRFIGLSWFINRYLFLNASYAHEKLKSNLPDDRYDVNQVWLTLGIER